MTLRLHFRRQSSCRHVVGGLVILPGCLLAAGETLILANRFRQHGESYLRFVTTPGIKPTNNLAEQAIRFVVIDRRITQGSPSEVGQRWLERIWTTIATCTHNGISVFDFLYESVTAHFESVAGPSLVAIDNSY